jgi:hypothetical protein
MATVTRGQLISLTREFMDAVGSERWSNSTIQTVLNSVYDEEWSNILNAAPFYTFRQFTAVTDSDGQIPFASLSSGSGDAEKNFYRILSINDGSVLYTQTSFTDVPLATTTTYLPTYPRLYYLVGSLVQILPVNTGVSLYVAVNYKPTALSDLSSDSVAIDWPGANETLLAAHGAYKLLLKGGGEVATAQRWKTLADDERETMLDDLRRRTINPTRMAYPDQKYDWAGG